MDLRIIAIGKDRRAEFAPAIKRYSKQLAWPLEIIEKQPKKPDAPIKERMAEEAGLMLQAAKNSHFRIALDERGKNFSSYQFADLLTKCRDDGMREIAFFIGGADGLDSSILQECDAKISFGAMVWPHQMVRVMLVEQLYRAYSIIHNHPYHRT